MNRLRFYLRSVNRHGVHSPFVFNLLQGLRIYRGKPLAERLQQYFGNGTVEIWDERLLAALKDKTIPADTIIYIKDIYQSRAGRALWAAAIALPAVRMSLEFREGGLLLFRKEFLVKQHYILRYRR